MNILTKFHEDRKINVASRVKNAPPFGSHVFQANTKLLTKFHEEWTINVASRENSPALGGHANILTSKVFTRKTAPAPGGHLHEDWTSTFRTQSRYQCDKCSAKFHEDQTINVASRVFTRQNVDDIQRTTDKRQSQSSP
ncbi:hypothetical protein DPMN_127342 [Dreissena polymorpha]|uniref:Uncharacterized protein n=1 Tax=Dreissena polymorpha TaxID=45954 RepID=A0A9D4GXG7_DREPO|nr:hypothetical protein DPMN_127342 [Dreissena polymorpha]